MPMKAYDICVATHLSSDWCVVKGLSKLAPDYNVSGQPITILQVQLLEHHTLLHVLTELHAANVMILRVDLVQLPTPSPVNLRR